jgi:hypothetical protein
VPGHVLGREEVAQERVAEVDVDHIRYCEVAAD